MAESMPRAEALDFWVRCFPCLWSSFLSFLMLEEGRCALTSEGILSRFSFYREPLVIPTNMFDNAELRF